MNKRVIVLGGGVAGMSAAHELAERGFKVHVYEARSIAGGKARSIPYEGTGKKGRKDLPGEHGLRFFPRFYRHVTDTMKRIPYNNNQNGVFDNLVGTSRVSIARFELESINLPAKTPTSIDDFKTIIEAFTKVIQNQVRLEKGELDFFIGKIWQLLTSCKERRSGEYEKISWWDYLEADDHSFNYKNLFAKGLTESLVASKANLASTKTVGDIFLQLAFDTLLSGESTDRVLNGPTNDVWIDPWLAYLRTLGVNYSFNSLVRSLNYKNGEIKDVTIKNQLTNEEYQVEGDYYIAALPIEIMEVLIRISKLDENEPTFKNISQLSKNTAWMNGIQYYLKEDVEIVPGHVLYVDTPWALTSISQKQFWPGFDLSEYGDGQVKGILSVCISDWGPFLRPKNQQDEIESKGVLTKKFARDCTEEEIVKEVWEQLKLSLNVNGKEVLKDENLHPDFPYFLDPSIVDVELELFDWMSDQGDVNLEAVIEYLRQEKDVLDQDVALAVLETLVIHRFVEKVDDKEVYRTCFNRATKNINLEPLLVNLVNTWALRPDAYTGIPNLFLASDYVRTNTDLATMEGANEAARRAVNAIIETSSSDSPLCKIWNLEEPALFTPWRWRDCIRYQEGLPWDGKLF